VEALRRVGVMRDVERWDDVEKKLGLGEGDWGMGY
jgi:hypothetical protein